VKNASRGKIKGAKMTELFAAGTFWFWALIVVELILLFMFTEYENGVGATVSLVVFGVVMGGIDILSYIAHHPLQLIVYAVVFFAFGVCWGVFQWRRLVNASLRIHDERLAEFVASKNLPTDTKVLPEHLRAEWKRIVDNTINYDTRRNIAQVPLVRQNKGKIITWMMMWPFSLSLYLFKDLLKEFFTDIYMKLSGFLQKMANSRWEQTKIGENLVVPEERRDGQ
jgi:hypothetical protein